MDINYQLVNSGKYRAKNVDRSIQTFKNHFIAGLRRVYMDFHLQLWERMIQQETISINLLRKSRLHPQLSFYAHFLGGFNYNCTQIFPQVKKWWSIKGQGIAISEHHVLNLVSTLDQTWNIRYATNLISLKK